MRQVAWIKGDGVGPEVTGAAVKIVEATKVPLEFVPVLAGERAVAEHGTPLPDDLFETVRRMRVCLKGPLKNPIGSGYPSPNHLLRQRLGLFASIRPNRSYPGIPVPFHSVNVTVLMHNMEGPDTGVDRALGVDEQIVEHIGVMTRQATERMLRFAFQFANEHEKPLVLVHLADQMKYFEGSWLRIAQEVSPCFPGVEFHDFLADALAAQLVIHPERFDIITGHHLWGDVFSALCSGLVGSLGMAAAINCGDEGIALFETAHGIGAELAGKDAANPTASIVAGKYMLEELGYREEARQIESALADIFAEGRTLTADLGGKATTSEFTQAVIQRL